jgi:hypothetical protein
MLEQLFNLIKNQGEQEIIKNDAIPNEMNQHAVGMATDSVFSGLQGALANGGVQQIMNLFSGKAGIGSGNPLVGGMMNSLVSGLMGKFGITNPIAQNIAASLIPKVLGNLVSKTSDPSDNSIDMNGIMQSLTGGGQQAPQGGLDFNNILDSLTGGKKVQPQEAHSDDNGFGMDDILKMVTGGGQAQPQQQQQAQSPMQGIFDMLTKGAQQQQQQQQSGGGVMDLLKGFMQ